MYKRIIMPLIFVGMLGCASTNTNSLSVKHEQNIPPTSKFSKIGLGMSQNQVRDLIGNWTDFEVRSTGKQHIPFYLGHDYTHTVQYYKGDGRIEFDSDGKVVDIQYNQAESGYK